ncbi:Las1-like-domain-containing protein [Phyllosticta paracitricarpa]|uniref:Las1-like-domain-containing protein n=1 Tax=Phyllosticta citricarpa TaxID=55181 RepID=A0ABR1LYR3_9PEZI
MPRYLVTPWRDARDLLSLRQNLYWRGDADDRRHSAVDTVAAWKRRMPLPHAIESTASLVDATLHDESRGASALAVRNAYCAAFNRFVTGFCDTVQTSFKKMSMYDMAAELDMPSSFVELRHEATHEDLPSLRRLQMATEQALEWLWLHYWAKLDAAVQTSQDTTEESTSADARADLHRILRAYLNNRRSEIRTFGASTHSNTSSYSHDTSRAIASLCAKHSHASPALASLLLDDRLIVPSDYQIAEPLDGAFLIWDPLLCTLDGELYLEAFVERAVALLASPSVEPKQDPTKAAIFEWLRHILIENAFSTRGHVMHGVRALAMTCCMAQPAYWCRKLAKSLLIQGDDDFQDEWLPILEASLPDAPGSANDENTEASITPAGGLSGVPPGAEDEDMQDVAQAQPPSPQWGWKKWQANWQPMPIGLVPT